MKKCATSNAYACLELNAHAMILLIERCRNSPDQFLILNFSSQPAEELFRELRSMTSTSETQVEFSMKEFGEKLRRALIKVQLSYRLKNRMTFPNIERRIKKYSNLAILPSNLEIAAEIERARAAASDVLLSLGIPSHEPSNALKIR